MTTTSASAQPAPPTYNIGEVSKILRLPQHTVRRWQDKAELPEIEQRTTGNQRVYTLASITEMAAAMRQDGTIKSDDRYRLVQAVISSLLALYAD
jgi:DNA-binding transcriptional MerR regulator